jgi:hypothetical protein
MVVRVQRVTCLGERLGGNWPELELVVGCCREWGLAGRSGAAVLGGFYSRLTLEATSHHNCLAWGREQLRPRP